MSLLADIPFSLLELAPMREDATVSSTLQGSLAYAQHAESLGFNRFWLAEHHNMPGIICSATSILIGFIPNQLEDPCFRASPCFQY